MNLGTEMGTKVQTRKRPTQQVSNCSVDVFQPDHAELNRMAEGVGFEPTVGYQPTTVFKTAALSRSAIPPARPMRVHGLCSGTLGCFTELYIVSRRAGWPCGFLARRREPYCQYCGAKSSLFRYVSEDRLLLPKTLVCIRIFIGLKARVGAVLGQVSKCPLRQSSVPECRAADRHGA